MDANIKKEPEDTLVNDSEDNAEEGSIGSPSTADLYRTMYESIKDIASATAKPNRQAARKMERTKIGSSEDRDRDYVRSDMCPDRTMSDFYCKICDAHMNSEQMWESHVSGKRHLKNVKKEPGEMPSKVKAIKVGAHPKLMDALHNVHEPLVGLGFMTELQRADKDLNPSYTCHLCQANCTWSVVIDHILTTKHRLAYLKAVDPEQYEVIENMELKKTPLDQLVEDRARAHERKMGCGTMEVKLEKPKIAPPPPKREKEEELSVVRHSRSLSSGSRNNQPANVDDDKYHHRRNRSRSRSPPYRYHQPSPSPSPPPPSVNRRRRRNSPVDEKWRHDRYSPSPPPASDNLPPPIANLPIQDKINLLNKLAESLMLISETHVVGTKNAISNLSNKVLQYKIRQLPLTTQNKLAKYIVRGDTKNLEKELQPTLGFVFDAVNTTDSSLSAHRRHHRYRSTSSKRRH